MKRKWNRLLALLLAAGMLSSEWSGLITPARAEDPPATPPTLVTSTGVKDDFRDAKNGRPNLFVDFLGDNANYIYTGEGANAGLTPRNAASLNTISTPAPYDQSKYTNPTGPDNRWFYYLRNPDCTAANLPGTVFWVGIGVDRTELLKLADGGLSSLEAGFYYDSNTIEPFVDMTLDADPAVAYVKTIEKANIQNPAAPNGYPANTQWSDAYHIVRAQMGIELTEQCGSVLAVEDPEDSTGHVCAVCGTPFASSIGMTDNGDDTFTADVACSKVIKMEPDQVTHEELSFPTLNDILNNAPFINDVAGESNWKMTYVSLELKDFSTTATRRLEGLYKGIDTLDTGLLDADNDGDADEPNQTVPIVPAGAAGNQYNDDTDPTSGYDYHYLLLIPFRLKRYGSVDWTPLRLVRDATHFSSGGKTWGVDAYGAWERDTTRNPEVEGNTTSTTDMDIMGYPARDLKLMTRFAGDLNLFTDGRTDELEYDALLRIIGDGGSLNTARLTVDGDPAVWPVWADTNGDIIGGLQSGLGMALEVHTQANYVASVTVTYVQSKPGGGELIYHPYTQLVDNIDNADFYTFVMPAFVPENTRRVTVTVTFTYKAGDDALVYLTEIPQPTDEDNYAVGNVTTIRTSMIVPEGSTNLVTTADTQTIDSFSSMSEHPNYSHYNVLNHPENTPVAKAKKDKYIEITVATHADYEAVVRIYDFKDQDYTLNYTAMANGIGGVPPSTDKVDNPMFKDDNNDGIDDVDETRAKELNDGSVVLPTGGTIRLRMGSQDVDVEVTYRKGKRYQATLEVYNENDDAADFDLNVAQLVYDVYDNLNAPSKGYSSVVYNDYDLDDTVDPPAVTKDDHRAIKPDPDGKRRLPWISATQATDSGSLGGDTERTGKVWSPADPKVNESLITGPKTIMYLLASAANKAALQASLSGLDLASVKIEDGTNTLVGLRKNIQGEPYGDADLTATSSDVDEPTLVDVLWELRTRIEADTATGGLKETYLKTVNKDDGSNTAAYTYYDLTPAQVQAYLLAVFASRSAKRENDRAYSVAMQRYRTNHAAWQQRQGAAYAGMAEPKAPAVNLSTDITDGTRSYQTTKYKDDYIAAYTNYLVDYEAYVAALDANFGTGGYTGPVPDFTGTAPSRVSIPLLPDADADPTDTDITNDARSVLANYTWATVTVPTDTALPGHTIETRSGRTVYVALEADSAYELESVKVYERGTDADQTTGALIASVTPAKVEGYQNVYSFTMPEKNCVVRVNYKLRTTRELKITYKGAAGLPDNVAVVEAYSAPTPPAVTPYLNKVTNEGYTGTPLPSGGSYDATNDVYTPDPVKGVFTESVVTVRGKADEDYEIKSVVATNADATTITVYDRPADDPADGTIFTFTIKGDRLDAVNLVITYGPKDESTYTATIRGTTADGSGNDNRNKATWYVVNGTTVTTPAVITDVLPGTHLVGHVSVAPGYYIKSVTASGASGNYAFTITGNGYNNGFGTTLTGEDIPIDIYVDMPKEDLVVDVVFAKGPPSPVPDNTLTLIVKDDDNKADKAADAAPNWAKAAVYEVKPAGTPDPADAEQLLPTTNARPGNVLGKNDEKGNGALTDRKYVETGKWVRVDFEPYVEMMDDPDYTGGDTPPQVVNPDKSYYVSSVTVGPDNLGIALRWESPGAVSFYMPAGSTAVTVTFSKYPSNGILPSYILNVRESYVDLNTYPDGVTPPPVPDPNDPNNDNGDPVSYITTAKSDTIAVWAGTADGARSLAWNTNPETVPPTSGADAELYKGKGAAKAGEKVTMTFDVDNSKWYYQSVVLVSNGSAIRLAGNDLIPTKTVGTVDTYEVEFYMPSSPAEFIVNYRRGPKPATPDYAFTLTIDDAENKLNTAVTPNAWDDNYVEALFDDPTGAASSHDALKVGHNQSAMTAVQHIHAGDIITLKTNIVDGYYLDYMIVNPAGLQIHPVWTDASTATFVMPKEGVAVLAKVVKGTPTQYTANLILRYEAPDGTETLPTGLTIHDIGRGTFTSDTVASLLTGTIWDDTTVTPTVPYPRKAIYSTVQTPGTQIDYDLLAFDGYYIDRVVIEPTVLGVKGSLSGSFGEQDGDFIMPPASVNVNVYFRKGWPDEVPYDLTLRAHDSSLSPDKTPTKTDNNYIALRTVTGRSPAPAIAEADTDAVYGGQTKVIDADKYPIDRDIVIVDVRPVAPKTPTDPVFYVDSTSIKVTDSRGEQVEWWYVPGGIAFVQPPRAVTVDVTFKREDPDNPRATYKATLHVVDKKTTDTSADAAILNDFVLMNTKAVGATQSNAGLAVTAPVTAAADTDADYIATLHHGDALDLSVLPGAERHVVYAYVRDALGNIIPVYAYTPGANPGDPDILTALSAQYVPGKPGTAATTDPVAAAAKGTATVGGFAMPERDVDVYVKFADGKIGSNDLAVNLIASGPDGSGSAKAELDDPKITDMTVTAVGMDSRFAIQGTKVVVTFDPDAGYDITKLSVTSNSTGAPVPYTWLSVLQDPELIENDTQDNTDLWSGTAPAPGITHPDWKPNPKKQIQLTVPAGGVTIHVTYGPKKTETFRAQVVVNDPLKGTAQANNSRNNAWLSQKDGADADDAVQKKLQTAVPGEWVDLDIYVHPGYRIEYVKVVPQSFGIVPGLPLGTNVGGVTYYLHDQSTGFVMPNGDCTVYVKFVADGIETKSATLVVNGAPTGNPKNHASISSPSGKKGPINVNGTPQAVSARPVVDWITVDYEWDTDTSAIASITVTVAGTTTAVPFTQVLDDPAGGKGQITFPMSRDDVIVTVTYQDDPTPVGQEVVLHVINKDGADNPILLMPDGATALNYGRLIFAGNTALNMAAKDTQEIAPGVPENTKTISVPAGQTVQVIASSDDTEPVYIESAYVLFEQNGQMIHFNLTPDSLIPGKTGPGYTGFHDESSFVVHPGRNDVYITLTRKAPVADEHAAVLMLRSPAEDNQSEAGIHADQTAAGWNSADPALRDKVKANDGDSHAYVVTQQGNKVTINVEPAPGYVIDYVQITPLGMPLDTDPVYHYKRQGNTITFDMPHCNVAVTVYLKRGSNRDYTATLHYIQDPNCPPGRLPQIKDYAKLTWTPEGEDPVHIWADANPDDLPDGATPKPTDQGGPDWSDIESVVIREGSTVTLDVTLDSHPTYGSDTILAAFVVWKDRGSIVQLTPTNPAGLTLANGLEGVTESASGAPDHNNKLADATGTFVMPMGDVEIYVVVTTDPPTDPWHTVALVATDHSPVENNSGLNEGDLWNNNDPTDKRTAISDKSLTPGDGKPTIAWITVLETDVFSVLPRAAAGYTFNHPAVMTGNNGVTRNLSTSYPNYLYEVSNILCNQVVRIDFASSDALELTVEIEDPDNPSNGTTEQVITVDPAGTTPDTLRLTSNSVAGSYQVVSGIAGGANVDLTATPAAGYSAYATLYYRDGSTADVPLADADADGVWTGSFTMPTNNARVVVTFYKGYTGTLTLVNHISGDGTGQATMKEDKRGMMPLMVHSLSPTDSFTGLLNATQLDAQVTSSMDGRKVTGLLTRKGATSILPATVSPTTGDPNHFYHTIDRADAEITLVLDSDANTYVAAVRAENKPDGMAEPEIEDTNTTNGPNQLRGDDKTWTTAVKDDTVTVTYKVPYGYTASVAASGIPGGAVVVLTGDATKSGPAAAGDPAEVGTVSFTMPAADVQVVVTYRRVFFDLTLRILDSSDDPTKNTTSVTGGATALTADGDSTTVDLSAGAVNIAVSAAPFSASVLPYIDPHIAGVYYQTADGAVTWLEPSALGAGAASNKNFSMPESDTTVTVLYDKDRTDDPETPYIATVEVVTPDGHPGNRAVTLLNTSVAGLPGNSPYWQQGYAGNGMKVSYEVEAGWFVTATAKRLDTDTAIPVLQMGSTTGGTASVSMPAANVRITLTYTQTPPAQTSNVALQLVGHETLAGNKAETTNFTQPTQLLDLAVDGTSTNHPLHFPNPYTDAADPVEEIKPLAAQGDDLRTLAGWATGSQVVRMTISVRTLLHDDPGDTSKVTGILETPEVELLTSRYNGTATSRAPRPVTTSDNDQVVIRVYYGNIYKAVFHLVGVDPTDSHAATDTVSYTVAYDNTNTVIPNKPIKDNLDRMEGYEGNGNEDIQTTAAVTADDRRVVDVIWESDLTGAASAVPNGTLPDNGNGRYDFTMPPADVNFYAFYEKEPDDPNDRAYVAKVAFAQDSAHLEDNKNAVSIKNLTNTSAAGGKYWTEAKHDETVEITVKVAEGFEAEIITAQVDDTSDAVLNALPEVKKEGSDTDTRKVLAVDPYHYYVSRTIFVPNLPGGKEATFTMPAGTDATVTIRFTKSYELSLVMTDMTAAGLNGSQVDAVEGAKTQGVLTADTDATLPKHIFTTTASSYAAVAGASGGSIAAAYPVTVTTTGGSGSATFAWHSDGTSAASVNARPGEDMVLDLTLPGGDYVKNVAVKSVADNVTQIHASSLSGTGYNGGNTGTAQLHFTMPAMAVNVELEFDTASPGSWTGTGSTTVQLQVAANGGASTASIYPQGYPGAAVTGDGATLTGVAAGTTIMMELNAAAGFNAEKPAVTFSPAPSSGGDVFAMGPDLWGFTIPNGVNQVAIKAVFWPDTSYTATTVGVTSKPVTIYNLNAGTDVKTQMSINNTQSVSRASYTDILGATRTLLRWDGTGYTLFSLGEPATLFAAETRKYQDVTMSSSGQVNTLVFDESPDPDKPILLAKVTEEKPGGGGVYEDINSNVANPIRDLTGAPDPTPPITDPLPAPQTLPGGAVTTTYQGNLIDVSLWVAKGYVAKIRVRRDDSYAANPNDPTKWEYLDSKTYKFEKVYWEEDPDNAGALKTDPETTDLGIEGESEVKIGYNGDARPLANFPGSAGGRQHFRFVMVSDIDATDPDGTPNSGDETPAIPACDVTVFVTFERDSNIPQPFDPRNDKYDADEDGTFELDHLPTFLQPGFIYGENRGDYAVIEIPTLAKDEGESKKNLYDTDNYGPDPDNPNDKKSNATQIKRFNFFLRTVADNGVETYTRLDPEKDVILVPYDPDDLKDPADPYNYYKGEDEGMWTGTQVWKDKTAGAKQKDFVGSKFLLYPTEPGNDGKRTANAQKLYDILNNKGSLETYAEKDPNDDTKTVTKYRTTLFVQAEDASGFSDYTEVWIRPWFALGVKVVSYGPTHPLEGELYKLMTQDALDLATPGYLVDDGDGNAPGSKDYTRTVNSDGIAQTVQDPDNFQHYKWDDDTKPAFTDSVVLKDEGSGKWLQILRIRSSDLLGDFDSTYDPVEEVNTSALPPKNKTLLDNVKVPAGDSLTFALLIKKVSNLTYTRIKIDLDPNSPTYSGVGVDHLVDYYEVLGAAPNYDVDYKSRTFMLQDTIQLIAGDVNGDGRTKVQDYDQVYNFIYRNRPWNADLEPAMGKPPTAAEQAAHDKWAELSVYSPDSMAYRCDLDGDRRLTTADLNLVNTRFNYNRDEDDYLWYQETSPGEWESTLPFGMGPRSNIYTALFGLDTVTEGEIATDNYWDALVDPAELLAVPMDGVYVDVDGNFRLESEVMETPPAWWEDPTAADIHAEQEEIPLGEEVPSHVLLRPRAEDAPEGEPSPTPVSGGGEPPEDDKSAAVEESAETSETPELPDGE